MRMPEGNWQPFIERLGANQGERIAASAKRLLERTIALSTDEHRIVTPPTRGSSRWQQDVCVDINERRTRLYWLSDIGVLIFEVSSSNTPRELPPLSEHPAFARTGAMPELIERLAQIRGAEQHDTRTTIKDLTLLEGEALDHFIDAIRWVIELIAGRAR